MNIYLWKKNGVVFYYAASTEAEAKSIAQQLDGFTTPPDSSATVEEWETAGSVAHIGDMGEIILGLPAEVKAKQEEIDTLTTEEYRLEAELAAKDYKVVKVAEVGLFLKDTDSDLHTRREWCRNRINEIRARLKDLEAVV
jgi:hypothetical protein